MPTLEEVAATVKFLMEKGDHARKCHFGLVDVEAKERAANPKGRTRFIKELDSPEAYSEWNTEWERWILACDGHKPIAQDLMLRALQQYSEPMIQRLAEGEHEAEHPTVGSAD